MRTLLRLAHMCMEPTEASSLPSGSGGAFPFCESGEKGDGKMDTRRQKKEKKANHDEYRFPPVPPIQETSCEEDDHSDDDDDDDDNDEELSQQQRQHHRHVRDIFFGGMDDNEDQVSDLTPHPRRPRPPKSPLRSRSVRQSHFIPATTPGSLFADDELSSTSSGRPAGYNYDRRRPSAPTISLQQKEIEPAHVPFTTSMSRSNSCDSLGSSAPCLSTLGSDATGQQSTQSSSTVRETLSLESKDGSPSSQFVSAYAPAFIVLVPHRRYVLATG